MDEASILPASFAVEEETFDNPLAGGGSLLAGSPIANDADPLAGMMDDGAFDVETVEMSVRTRHGLFPSGSQAVAGALCSCQ